MKNDEKEESNKCKQLKLALKQDPVIIYLPHSAKYTKMNQDRILYIASLLN